MSLTAEPSSPDRERKHIENEILRGTWKSTCCGRDRSCSKALVILMLQSAIAFMVLVFCMLQLALALDPENKAVYFSLISSLVTLFLPSPVTDEIDREL